MPETTSTSRPSTSVATEYCQPDPGWNSNGCSAQRRDISARVPLMLVNSSRPAER